MAKPSSPTTPDESREQRHGSHAPMHPLLYLTPSIASQSAKSLAMANASMYEKKILCMYLDHKQNGLVQHVKAESNTARHLHHVVHVLQRAKRKPSVSVSFMLAIIQMT